MVWVKLDDAFPEHRKALDAGDDACWMFVSALCYSARNLTDGFVPAAQVTRLTGQRSATKLAARLVDVGLFDVVDGGYQIHDYEEYQPLRAEVEESKTDLSRKRSEAGKKGARSRWANGKRDGKPDGKTMASGSQSDGPEPEPVNNSSLPSRTTERGGEHATEKNEEEVIF